MEQADERAEERNTQDEALGAIDGVQHPHVLGLAPLGAEFLADDAMVGESPRDHLPHHLFGAAIGEGHRR